MLAPEPGRPARGDMLDADLIALDDRVTCAAPACYIKLLEWLSATAGPQDAEQNIILSVSGPGPPSRARLPPPH